MSRIFGGGGVVMQARSREWGALAGLGSSSEESEEEDIQVNRRQRYARIAAHFEQDSSDEKEEKDAPKTEAAGDEEEQSRLRMSLMPTCWFCVYNAINLCILYLIYMEAGEWLLWAALLPPCLFLAAIEACLAWTDRDVARVRYQLFRQGYYVSLVLFQGFVVVFLGCAYGYHLVRAYRNLKKCDLNRTFLTEVEAMDPSRQALVGTVRWDAWDIVWGPPVVFSLAFFLGTARFYSPGEALFWAAILTVVTVSMVLDACTYDFSASHHIRNHFGTVFDVRYESWVHKVNGVQSMRRFQMAHFAFRFSEAVIRVLVVAGLAAVSRNFPRSVAALFVMDFSLGCAALCWASTPSVEAALCSVAIFFMDVTRFVDEPGFAYPAQRISAFIRALRAGEAILAATACVCLGGYGSWIILSLLAAAVGSHVAIRRRAEFGKLRDDLFTAIARGDLQAIQESLTFDGGCTVNMRLCGASERTALHFAVARGKDECVNLLINRRGDVNLTDSDGNTPLHLACRQGNLGLVSAILRAEGSNFHPKTLRKQNSSMKTASDLVDQRADPGIKKLLEEEDKICHDSFGKCVEREKRVAIITASSGCSPVSCSSSVTSSTSSPMPGESSIGMDVQASPSYAVQVSPSRRPSIFGAIAGGQHFHVWVGPRDQVGRMELASFMFSRGVGEQAERLIDHFQNRRSKVRLAYLQTVSTLGVGGFGRVLKVQDVRTGEVFAMKLQKKDKATRQAIREARELHKNQHPYIVGLIHIFHTTVFYGIMMEFCDRDLNIRIIENSAGCDAVGGLPLAVTARYTVCIMLALEHLHMSKVVFRDLKPENVLVTSKEAGDYAKLTDFGMAKSMEQVLNGSQAAAYPNSPSSRSPVTRMTLKAGTLAFMSEEAMDDEDSDEEDGEERQMDWYAARDWYSLGCCLMLMLLGERGGRKVRHIKREVLLPPPHSDIPRRLSLALEQDLLGQSEFQVVSRLTSKKARDRANSVNLRNSPFLSSAIRELEEFPVQ